MAATKSLRLDVRGMIRATKAVIESVCKTNSKTQDICKTKDSIRAIIKYKKRQNILRTKEKGSRIKMNKDNERYGK